MPVDVSRGKSWADKKEICVKCLEKIKECTCDNPSCVNPEHLREGDYIENTKDRVERERTVRGEKQHSAKLTESDVLEIKNLISRGLLQKEIAQKFGVGLMAISNIKLGKTWRYLK